MERKLRKKARKERASFYFLAEEGVANRGEPNTLQQGSRSQYVGILELLVPLLSSAVAYNMSGQEREEIRPALGTVPSEAHCTESRPSLLAVAI
jgi:hypothetical protein